MTFFSQLHSILF